jgi:hypothetical protein
MACGKMESVMRPEGDGHGTSSDLGTTKFLYHGDPRDTSSWASINEFDHGSNVKCLSSVSLGRMDPGKFKKSRYGLHVPSRSKRWTPGSNHQNV